MVTLEPIGAVTDKVDTKTMAMIVNPKIHCSANVFMKNCPTANPAARKEVANPTVQSPYPNKNTPAKGIIPQMATFARILQTIAFSQWTMTAPFQNKAKKVQTSGMETAGI